MRRPLLFWCVAVLAVLYCAILLGAGDLIRTALSAYAGEEVLLTGRVVSVTRYDGYTRVVLRATAVGRDQAEDAAADVGKTAGVPAAENTADTAARPAEGPLKKRETVLLTLTGDWEYRRLAGSEVTVWTTLRIPAGKRNPGGFDYRMYLRGKRIAVTGSGPAAYLHETGRQYPLLGLAANLRETFTEWLEERTDRETASLLTAMVLGEKSMLSEETESDFRRSGLSHLMAVSGLHVTLLFAWISKASRAPKGKAAVIRSLVLLALYGWICAFSPSVVRGILMIVFRKAADLLHRRYDMLTAIGLSAVFSAVANPFSIVQAGFLLSYGAVLSLALVLPAIEAKTEAKLRLEMPLPKRAFWETAKLTGASLAIASGMLPLQLLLFRQLTPASIVLNVPAIALAGIVMPLGFLLFLFANLETLVPFSLFASGAFCTAESVFTAVPLFFERFLTGILRLLARVGSFYTVRAAGISSSAAALLLGTGLFVSGEWFRMNRERNRKRTAIALLLTVLVTGAVGLLADDSIGRNALVFVDVGQGDCLHIHERAFVRSNGTERAAGREAENAAFSGGRSGITFASVDFLIDGGGSANANLGEGTLLPYLLSQGVTHLDGVLATHLHTDHFKGLAELCREVDVGGLILFSGERMREAEVLEATGLPADRLCYVSAGDTVVLSPDVSLDILWPEEPVWADAAHTIPIDPAKYADENASSLVVRVNFRGVSCLMTADIGAEGEEALLAYAARIGAEENDGSGGTERLSGNILCADVLKVAHHGSRFSTTDVFLSAVSPKAAVIQVGAFNSYGHPAPATVEKLERSGIMVYRNDRQGAVIVRPLRNGFRVRTMRKDAA